jgi:hypothetical protein
VRVVRVRPVAVLAVAAVLLAACAGGEGETPGPQPTLPRPTLEVPADVPQSAQPAHGSLELGHIEHPFGPDPDVSQARTLEGMACAGDLLMVRTDRETVYARMPCDRFLAPEQVATLEGNPAAIRVDVGQDQRLLIESTAGNAAFSVTGVWVEER